MPLRIEIEELKNTIQEPGEICVGDINVDEDIMIVRIGDDNPDTIQDVAKAISAISSEVRFIVVPYSTEIIKLGIRHEGLLRGIMRKLGL